MSIEEQMEEAHEVISNVIPFTAGLSSGGDGTPWLDRLPEGCVFLASKSGDVDAIFVEEFTVEHKAKFHCLLHIAGMGKSAWVSYSGFSNQMRCREILVMPEGGS